MVTRRAKSKKKKKATAIVAEAEIATESSEFVPAAKSSTKNPSRTLDPIVEEEKKEVSTTEHFSPETELSRANWKAKTKAATVSATVVAAAAAVVVAAKEATAIKEKATKAASASKSVRYKDDEVVNKEDQKED